jgi:haloalkane dehalogenase
MNILRTPEDRFAFLPDYPFAPQYHHWQGLRMHYVDEGAGAPVLMLHGEPTWSYLYRKMIPLASSAGFRAIAPDYIGFGKSEKVEEDSWYVIERHVESIRSLIETLDLHDITLVVQDWGGPIGLRQAVDMPERFRRLVILNTWLYQEGSTPSEGMLNWRAYAMSQHDLPCGRVIRRSLVTTGHDLDGVETAYDAPFPDARYKAGPRRFPWCLPYAQPDEGNAADQQRCFEALQEWRGPVHIMFSDHDPVFPPAAGQKWAKLIPGATFDVIEGPGHFLQEERGEEIAKKMLGYMSL